MRGKVHGERIVKKFMFDMHGPIFTGQVMDRSITDPVFLSVHVRAVFMLIRCELCNAAVCTVAACLNVQ